MSATHTVLTCTYIMSYTPTPLNILHSRVLILCTLHRVQTTIAQMTRLPSQKHCRTVSWPIGTQVQLHHVSPHQHGYHRCARHLRYELRARLRMHGCTAEAVRIPNTDIPTQRADPILCPLQTRTGKWTWGQTTCYHLSKTSPCGLLTMHESIASR